MYHINQLNQKPMKTKIKKQTINFKFKGKSFKFTFTPEETDWWTAFQSKGFEFDVHYCEEYDHIVVYEVIDGEAQTNGDSVYCKELGLVTTISKTEVVKQLMSKFKYGKGKAENLIEKHIDVYEINCDDKDMTARFIAMDIEEAEMQGN